jgi:NAD(P)H-dependent FMN reductase
VIAGSTGPGYNASVYVSAFCADQALMESINHPVFLPVILGTARQGRISEPAARFVFEEVSKRPDVTTELIDIRNLRLSVDDAGEALKDTQFSATVSRADGLILVVPEYNHSFPGLLKHVLDSNLKEYIHKAVGVCGVSAGSFGGARMIQSLLPVLRELGLVTIFRDVYFGTAGKLFDSATGNITDPAYAGRLKKFVDELVWMARALRFARENIPEL